MSVFPDTPAYFILYTPGSCGTFLGNLINCNLGLSRNIKLSPNNNAHQNMLYRNVKRFDWSTEIPIYQLVEPIVAKIPIFIFDHKPIDYSDFFKKFPIGKLCVIQHTSNDLPFLKFNVFSKIFFDTWNLKSTKEHFEQCSKEFFNGVKTPWEVSKSVLSNYLKLPKGIEYPHNIGDIVECENVFYITYQQIINDKAKTLELISHMTNRDISLHTEENYDKYVEIQKNIDQQTLKLINDN